MGTVLAPIGEADAESFAAQVPLVGVRRSGRERKAVSRFEDRYASEIRSLMIKDDKLDKDIRDTAGDISAIHKRRTGDPVTALAKRLRRSMTQRIRNEKKSGAADSPWLEEFYVWEKRLDALGEGDSQLEREMEILEAMQKRGVDVSADIAKLKKSIQAASTDPSALLAKFDTELLQPYLEWLKEDKRYQEAAAAEEDLSSSDSGSDEEDKDEGAVTKAVRQSRREDSDDDFEDEGSSESGSDTGSSLIDEAEDDFVPEEEPEDDVLDWNDTTFSKAARREGEDDESEESEESDDSDEESDD